MSNILTEITIAESELRRTCEELDRKCDTAIKLLEAARRSTTAETVRAIPSNGILQGLATDVDRLAGELHIRLDHLSSLQRLSS